MVLKPNVAPQAMQIAHGGNGECCIAAPTGSYHLLSIMKRNESEYRHVRSSYLPRLPCFGC